MNDLVEAMVRADTQLELEAAYQAVREHPDWPLIVGFNAAVWQDPMPATAASRPFGLVVRLRMAVKCKYQLGHFLVQAGAS